MGNLMESNRLDAESHSVRRREQLVLLILAAVQFTTIVDFMIVMPLGPQLMRTMNIDPAEFGLVVSSYTFAAGLAGLIASAIADRFARRTTFMVLYAGFLLGHVLLCAVPDYRMLVLARFVTGGFGGILGGMSMAIIGDVFPEERRGRATGSLMTGFALASVFGVPLGLYLGSEYGWHVPFVALAIAGSPALFITPFATAAAGWARRQGPCPSTAIDGRDVFACESSQGVRAHHHADDRQLHGFSASAGVSRSERGHGRKDSVAMGLCGGWSAHVVYVADCRQARGSSTAS